MTKEFVYGSYVDEVVAYRQAVGGVVGVYYPHYNHLYSVAALTDGAGQVVEKYSYDSYGKQTITSATGVVRQKSAVGFDRGFTGYIADSETGLDYARARMYSPTLGRFIARDPVTRKTYGGIGIPAAGMGYYDGFGLYASNFVPNVTDPYGYYPLSGRVEVDSGTLVWTLSSQDKGAAFTATFEPKSPPCCCRNISFIQVVAQHQLGNNPRYPNPADYYRQFGDSSGNNRLDHLMGEDDPYYGAQWNASTSSWEAEGRTSSVGSCYPTKKDAHMEDKPRNSLARTGAGALKMEFETCAVCIDTGEKLACVRWGLTVPDESNGEGGVWEGDRPGPSRDFNDAIGRWNRFAGSNPGFHQTATP